MGAARTIQQLVERSLRVVGILAAGETANTDDTGTALIALQDLIAEWGIDHLVIPTVTVENFGLSSGTETYTIGESSADFDTVRPEEIIGAYVRTSTHDYPVRIVGEEAYRLIADKESTESRPTILWYNPTYPNGTIYLYPTPSDGNSDLYLASKKPLVEPTALSDTLADIYIPRNFHNPLMWALACEIAPEYGREVTAFMAMRAAAGYNNLVALNASRSVQAARLEIPMGSGGVYGTIGGIVSGGVGLDGDYITFGGDVVVF